ncbi:LLM class flavin-dependent oxidoreductase [Streptomyces sp. UG1]|uniref:LLM class flavin-dependent oxidoreductase n=1 Tax=Streptomyces sp. UG1 TaxID=3417652 RepID=UPI003CF9D971
MAGAAVAAVTERVGIRAGSVVAPLQDPLRIAEEWSVVDNISGGRAAVSFASGWHPHDFVLNPPGYNSRQEDVIAAMKTVRQLWRGEPVTRVNGLGKEIPVRVYPPPVQREPPMWLTSAGSTDTFRLAGEMGAGVLTHLVKQGVDVLAENIAVYREAFRTTACWRRPGGQCARTSPDLSVCSAPGTPRRGTRSPGCHRSGESG